MRIESITPQNISKLTELLHSWLGRQGFGLLHEAVGAKDVRQLIDWTYGKSYPDDEQLERLIFVYTVVRAVRDHRGANFARVWFAESRCRDGVTIYDSVRVCNYDLVRDSVNELGANLSV